MDVFLAWQMESPGGGKYFYKKDFFKILFLVHLDEE